MYTKQSVVTINPNEGVEFTPTKDNNAITVIGNSQEIEIVGGGSNIVCSDSKPWIGKHNTTFQAGGKFSSSFSINNLSDETIKAVHTKIIVGF